MPSEASPLLFSLLIPLGCLIGHGQSISGPAPGHAFGAGFRALAALLLPPVLFHLVGQSLADWPLAQGRSAGESTPTALALLLGAALFARSTGPDFRIQPLLAGITFLSVLLLPLGIALERFLEVLSGAAFGDVAHTGMIAIVSSGFALAAHLCRGGRDPSCLPLGNANAHGGLAIAWIGAALSNCADPLSATAALMVATGTAFVVSTCASIAAKGVALPRLVLVGLLAGLLAAAPAASILTPRAGALAGLLGAGLGVLVQRTLRTFSVHDDIFVPAHLGGGIGGFLVWGLAHLPAHRSPWLLALPIGVALGCAVASLLAGGLFWGAARGIARLDADPDELEIGLDLVEHGCAPDGTNRSLGANVSGAPR